MILEMDCNVLKYLHGIVFLPGVLLFPSSCVLVVFTVGLVLSCNSWADKMPFDSFLLLWVCFWQLKMSVIIPVVIWDKGKAGGFLEAELLEELQFWFPQFYFLYSEYTIIFSSWILLCLCRKCLGAWIVTTAWASVCWRRVGGGNVE